MEMNSIKTITVVGAGLMGHGIAQVFAQAGYSVWLVDLKQAALERALNLIQNSLNILEKKGVMPKKQGREVLARIRFSTDLMPAAAAADFVVEAVAENAEIKRTVFGELQRLCPPTTLFASNTSGLDVFNLVDPGMAGGLIATHFFAPAQIIPLVEVCPGPQTRPEVVELTRRLLLSVGKEPVVMQRFVPSFIVNRIQN